MKHLPLDMSKFRKINEDKDSATLRHHYGHEIKIAKGKLSTKLRDQLEALPTAKPKEKKEVDYCRCDETEGDNPACKKHPQERQKFAGGGPAWNRGNILEMGEPQKEEPAQEYAGPSDVEAVPDVPKEDIQESVAPPVQRRTAAPAPQAPAAPAFDPYAPSTPVGPANTAGTPESAYVGPPRPAPEKTIKQHADEFGQDLVNGHIKPLQYKDLFADQGTLGKIGSMFALMASGMGSAVTGQPNMLLGMMDKEIERDLQAQMKSKEYAQNFYRLNQEAAMNIAKINQMRKEGRITDAEAESRIADVRMKNFQVDKAIMYKTTLHNILGEVAKLPPGSPEAVKAQGALSVLAQNADKTVADASDQFALNKAMFGGSGGDDEEAFKNQNEAFIRGGNPQLAAEARATHVPGIYGRASRHLTTQEQQHIQDMVIFTNKGQDVLKYVKQHRGTWNPQTKSKAEQMIDEMQGFYNNSIGGGALTEGRLGWYNEQFNKNPTDLRSQLMGSNQKLEEMVNSNDARLETILSGKGGLGFPKQSKMYNGVRHVRGPNGKAVPVK